MPSKVARPVGMHIILLPEGGSSLCFGRSSPGWLPLPGLSGVDRLCRIETPHPTGTVRSSPNAKGKVLTPLIMSTEEG